MASSFLIFLKTQWRNTVYSNIWIALCAAMFCWQGEILVAGESEWTLPCFTFFATVFLYNFQRAVKFSAEKKRVAGRNHWMFRNRRAIWLWVVVSGICTFFLLWKLPARDWVVLAIAGLISVAYVTPVLSWQGKRLDLREIPGLKLPLIAISWVITGVIFPWGHHQGNMWLCADVVTVIAAEKLLFIAAITIPFDIRDLPFDRPHMRTIPQLLGARKATVVAIVLALLAAGLSGYQLAISLIEPTQLAALLSSYLITVLLLFMSFRKQEELYYTGWLDATIFIQAISFILASYMN